MTENEAIMLIDNEKPSCGEKIIFAEGDRCEAIDMAINALEEIQQYHEIGTVEELKTMKEHGGFTGIELAEISAALGSLGKYCAIGTVEECRAAVGKQKAKKPSHKYVKYGKHKWRRKENGEIDDWAWDFEFCNGVVCERCGESVCVHCNPNYDYLEDCEVDLYNCPTCNKGVYRIQKYCDCGQKLDWSDKE